MDAGERFFVARVACRVTAEYLAFVAVQRWESDPGKTFTRDQLSNEACVALVHWGEQAFCEIGSPLRHARLASHPRLADARAMVAEFFPELAAREVTL